jgi:hypothetical protein
MSGRADKSGDLVMPFVFVPKGDAPPAEWMAAHPGWVRIPARMVPRNTAGAAAGWQLQFDPFVALGQGIAGRGGS